MNDELGAKMNFKDDLLTSFLLQTKMQRISKHTRKILRHTYMINNNANNIGDALASDLRELTAKAKDT